VLIIGEPLEDEFAVSGARIDEQRGHRADVVLEVLANGLAAWQFIINLHPGLSSVR